MSDGPEAWDSSVPCGTSLGALHKYLIFLQDCFSMGMYRGLDFHVTDTHVPALMQGSSVRQQYVLWAPLPVAQCCSPS